MDFVEWMKSTGLSEKSASSYSGALTGRLSHWAEAHGLTTTPLWEIPEPTEFFTLSEKLRQTPEFIEKNKTGNGMYAAALKNFQKYLHVLNSGPYKMIEYGPHKQQVAKLEVESGEPFDPKDQEDARARALREVVQRRGQQKFRKTLLAAYNSRCAITGCPVIPLLEAAHITPYLGPETNSITNGLLLRSDLHTLWDLGLIAAEPENHRIWVNPDIADPTYRSLSGVPLQLPQNIALWPSKAALEQQWAMIHTKLAAQSGRTLPVDPR